jgi:poly-gamma-glutamate synthesis protein (capsule biosynthesis protein)
MLSNYNFWFRRVIVFGLVFFSTAAFSKTADLVLSAGGDVNFSKHLWRPHPLAVGPYPSTVLSFEEQFRGILPLIAGSDVNFANIETVLTDQKDLDPQDKTFNFQAHPAGLDYLIESGFNLFSLANNHSHDYGLRGIEETLRHSSLRKQGGKIAFSGVGLDLKEAVEPAILEIKGYRIGFVAMGISGFLPTNQRAGVLSYNRPEHYKLALEKLRTLNVDLRIVSIHTGTEGRVDLDHGQRERFLEILQLSNADLILGHHPHVVRPVEILSGKVIFYSLGNYAMIGSANITNRGLSQDFGLLTKVYFVNNSQTGKPELRAIQLLPLTDTHRSPRLLDPSNSRERINHLNKLAQSNLPNGRSIVFEIENATGTGFWQS